MHTTQRKPDPLSHMHCEKRFMIFPGRESLVSDFPARNGKIVNLFFQCTQLHSPPNITSQFHHVIHIQCHILMIRGSFPGPLPPGRGWMDILCREYAGKTVHVVFRYLSIRLLVERGRCGWSNASTSHKYPSWSVNISFKENVTDIPFLDVSFMGLTLFRDVYRDYMLRRRHVESIAGSVKEFVIKYL